MAPDESQLKGASYESFIFGLSILSLANLLFVVLFPGRPATEIVQTVDFGLSLILLIDFGYRLLSAPSKRRYFLKEFGWLDLIGSLPFQPLRLARLYRVVAVARALGLMRGRLWRTMVRERAGATLFAVLFLVVLLMELASSLVLVTEIRDPESNIRNASDALWWTWVTVMTVGYGDRYPVTNTGRLIGALTMAVGVGLVGALTGFLANAFLRPNARYEREERDRDQHVQAELAEIRRELSRLRGVADADVDQ
jgi:voltage-gated potassium channel